MVVGLGNPGARYEGTRHNVGFAVLDLLARQCRADGWRRQDGADVARGTLAATATLLVKPQTYMNCSGEPAGAIARYYKVATAEVLVAHDELDFEPGVLRLKQGGGHGGHNGLRSLMAHLSGDFARLRIGIGRPPPGAAGADYVLGRIDGHSRAAIADACIAATAAVQSVLQLGVARAMNHVNRHPGPGA